MHLEKKYLKYLLMILKTWRDRGIFNWIPDSLYLKMIFRTRMGYSLNLKNPQTFNEKLQWLKLHDRNPLYTKLVDKYEVRKFVMEKIGEEYLIPLLGVWDSPDEIDFSILPDQFVLKCTHDCGSVIVCINKNEFDIEKTKCKLRDALKKNFYCTGREWPYKNVEPKIICEKFMEDESKTELKDYKVYCFNGIPKIIQVISDRFIGSKSNLYDGEWNYIHLTRTYPTAPNKIINKPNSLGKMLSLAKILSKDCPFVRVDFYSIIDKIYFGELTFTPASGFGVFDPKEFDLEWGNWLVLPEKNFDCEV